MRIGRQDHLCPGLFQRFAAPIITRLVCSGSVNEIDDLFQSILFGFHGLPLIDPLNEDAAEAELIGLKPFLPLSDSFYIFSFCLKLPSPQSSI